MYGGGARAPGHGGQHLHWVLLAHVDGHGDQKPPHHCHAHDGQVVLCKRMMQLGEACLLQGKIQFTFFTIKRVHLELSVTQRDLNGLYAIKRGNARVACF